MMLREGDFWWRERWPATLATLIAIGLFWLSNGPSPVIILLMVIWLAGYFASGRIGAGPGVIWAARIVLFVLVYVGNAERETNLVDSIFFAQWNSIFGQCAIAEFALRRWRANGVPLWADVLPSAVIMISACSTMESLYVTFLAPLYFLFIVLAFAQISHRADAPLPWRWLNLATRISSLLLAIAIGGFANYCFMQYKMEIMNWGSAVLGERVGAISKQGDVTGISKSPVLASSFAGDTPPTRILIIHGTLPTPYMRGMSFSDYTRGYWGPPVDARKYRKVGHGALIGAPVSAYGIDVDRLVSDDEMVSYPLNTSSIGVPKANSISWAESEGGPLRVGSTGTLQYHCEVPQKEYYQGLACLPPSPTERQRLLEVPPEVDRNVVRIGQKVTAGADGVTAIHRVERFLMSNNRYSESTKTSKGDPLSNFILQRKSADCEYFGAAATMLLRAGGIPTRFVIGYYAHESGPDGTIVRASDAHAWAESYVDKIGWVTVDATPASGRPDVTRKLGLWWQIRDAWDDFIRHCQQRWMQMSRLQQTFTAVVIGAFVWAYFLVRGWSSRRKRIVTATHAYTAKSAALAQQADRFERLLARRHVPCPQNTPWQEHVSQISEQTDSPAPIDTLVAQDFVSRYSKARFGNDDGDLPHELDALLSKLESETR